MDNSFSIMYNGNKKNKGINTSVTVFAKQWKEKNQGVLKYAGDCAKKSVDAGLKEAPDYMQDSDEGTILENVQTASVNLHLAKDSNDDKLHQSALMEMIGHLSKDNKELYYKHIQPLQKYYDDFEYAYTANTMLGDIEYFKVLSCDGKYADVYYVSKNYTVADVLTFEKIQERWVNTRGRFYCVAFSI